MKIFFEIMFGLFSWLKYPIFFIIALILIFFGLIYTNVAILYLKGKRFKEGERIKIKKKSIFRRVFIDLPHRIAEDLFDSDPEKFGFQGCVIFEGRQGYGKTISMIQYAREMQRRYPKSKCLSNLNYKLQDEELDDWRKLIDFNNEKFGVIAIIDEMQNWFSSNQSRDFPPEMLGVITQNRKNKRIILGTSQNFYLLAKAIRSQATEVRRCSTFFGALTIVHRVIPILNSDGNVCEWKSRGYYFFVHDKELRESYDTYHVIESLKKSGFQERKLDTTTNIYIKNKK